MNEELSNVQPAVAEQASAEQTSIEQVSAEQAGAEKYSLPDSILGDLLPELPNQAPAPTPAPAPGLDVDKMAELLAERLEAKSRKEIAEAVPEEDGDDSYISKKELQRILQEQQQKAIEIEESKRLIAEATQTSGIVVQKYVDKLTDILNKTESNSPEVQQFADVLFQSLVIKKAAELNRPLYNPITGTKSPVLTAAEMAVIAEEHFTILKDTFLKPKLGGGATTNPSLGMGNAALTSAGETRKDNNVVNMFLEKKKANKETLTDVIAALRNISTQKK